MSLFNSRKKNEQDDESIYSTTSSMFSTSSRMSKIPKAVKSSMKYLIRRNKSNNSNNDESESLTTKLKRHTTTLFQRSKENIPTSTASTTLITKPDSNFDIIPKRRNSSVVNLSFTVDNKQDELVDFNTIIEESDSRSEKIIYNKPKREEPWIRQRAKSCQDNNNNMLRQLANKSSSINSNSINDMFKVNDLPLFKGLVTTTLTTLHTRLTNECDRIVSSLLLPADQQQQEKELPFKQLLSIISDLYKMIEMVNWESEQEKKGIKDNLNLIEASVLNNEDELTIITVKDNVSTMKQMMNQCICQYYKVNEKAMVIPSKGYKIEGSNTYTDTTVVAETKDYSASCIDHKDPNAHWYRTYFLDSEDVIVTFFGYNLEGDPIIISIKVEENKDTSTNRQFRVIYRSKKNDDQRKVILDSFLLNAPFTSLLAEETKDIPDTTWKSIIETTFNIPYHQLQKMNQSTLVSTGLQDELLRLDENSLHARYKFGVLLIKEGQTREEEWFSNESNEVFDEFLDIIGNKVQLEGYTGWAAGLDTKSGDSGEYTYTNVWNENILAYHVSTLIPSRPGDKQQIQRKRHIGNDIVCIVFVQGHQPFNPAAIKSQFLHVFIIVHNEINEGINSWRVEVVSVKDVPNFGPPLPQEAIFYDPIELQQFLLAKLVNAEYAAFKSPKFSTPMNRAREGIFTNLVEKGCKILNDNVNLDSTDSMSMTTSCTTIASSNTTLSLNSSPKKLLFHTKSASTSSSSQSTTHSSSNNNNNSNVIPSPSKSSQAILQLSRRKSTQDLVSNENKPLHGGGKKFITEASSNNKTRSHSEQDLIQMTTSNGKNTSHSGSFKQRLLTSIPRFGNSSSSS